MLILFTVVTILLDIIIILNALAAIGYILQQKIGYYGRFTRLDTWERFAAEEPNKIHKMSDKIDTSLIWGPDIPHKVLDISEESAIIVDEEISNGPKNS